MAQRSFHCGVFRGVDGSLVSFAIDKGKSLPNNLETVQDFTGTMSQAQRLAKSLLPPKVVDPYWWAKADAKPPEVVEDEAPVEEAPPTITEGSVCVHNDPEGHHSAVILRINGDMAQALFLSSKMGWGSRWRPASRDECMLLGLTPRRPTFLVLVERPLRSFYMHKSQIPNYRLDDLRDWFGVS